MSALATTQTLGGATLAAPHHAKVSRYRSLRGKSVSGPRGAGPDVFSDGNTQAEIVGLRRRSKSVAAIDLTRPPPIPAFPFPPPSTKLPDKPTKAASATTAVSAAAAAAASRKLKASKSVEQVRGELNQNFSFVPKPGGTKLATRSDVAPRAAANLHGFQRNLAINVSGGGVGGNSFEREELERRRKEEEEAVRWADEVARLVAETDRILAEQRKRDLARAHAAQQSNAPDNKATSPVPKEKIRSPVLERFSFLTRSRRSNASHTTNSTATNTTSTTTFTTLSPTSSTTTSVDFSHTSAMDSPRYIGAGGKGIVPQTDAPASASNAGERRVTVRCMASSITLPVIPETSPVDILYSSANLMTHKINPATSIVIESYLQLGLERRLRRYEKIRDVMNSWDKDSLNCLLVLPCDVPENDKDLDIDGVPRGDAPPYGFTFQLHHCARVGKWNKRYITLLESGQMFASKKPGAGATDKDSQTLCHMSDFDIYSPTENQMKKALKPPKKYCYAVKSQQKTSVFSTGENFAHFFCTEDVAVAHKFHELVHAWRSWYLVNRGVDLEKKISRDPPPQIKPVRHAPKKSISVVRDGTHKLKVSVDETPYAIGQFQPLIDMQRFNKPIDEFGKDFIPEPKSTTHRAKEIPRPKRLSRVVAPGHAKTPSMQAQPLIQAQGSDFDSRGLLGDGYAAKKEQAKRESKEQQIGQAIDGPFTGGPSLLNSSAPSEPGEPPKPEPSPWLPSAIEHTAKQHVLNPAPAPRPPTSEGPLHRSNTQRRPPPGRGEHRPLVNLSNKFPEPPSWRDGHGHGHGVRAPAGVPLVDFATGNNHQQNNFLEAPPRGIPRRDPPRPGPPMGQTLMQEAYGQAASRGAPPVSYGGGSRNRSRSTAGTPARRFEHEAPSMPPLPPRGLPRDVPHERSREGREGGYGGFGKQMPPGQGPPVAMRGRSGTIRY